MTERNKIDWMNLAAICGIWSTMITILAVCIASPLYLGSKIDNFRSQMYEEMKDFHGRMCIIEERNKGK
jgi:hypothetical protein